MVRSLYFDTIDDTDYTEKEDGYEYRKKIRLRIYSPSANNAKLEMKEKLGDNQRKRSLNISKEHALELISGRYECLLSYENPFALGVIFCYDATALYAKMHYRIQANSIFYN